jgi:hypothetical protein
MIQELVISEQIGPGPADVSTHIIEPRNLMEYSRRTFFRDDDCADLVRKYERQIRPVPVEMPRLTAPAPWPHRPKENIEMDYEEYFNEERCAEIAQRVRGGESFSAVCHSFTASAPTIKRYMEKAGWDPLTGQRLAGGIPQPAKPPPAAERSRANSEPVTAVSVAEAETVGETAVSASDGETAVSMADGLDRLISLRRLVADLQAAGLEVGIHGRIQVTIEF